MTINLHLPNQHVVLRPTITVIGVGGAGGNAVNNMITARLEGVDFVVANTDAQSLDSAQTERKIQLGMGITKGLGAGADPQVGRAAAEEAIEDIINYMEGSNMVFITAGMGGGTGTGAAPVVARAARELGILTVGVVTKPFQFEGANRMRMAEQGLKDLQQYVDTLIVIPNQNLFRLATEKTTFADAFRMADEVLHSGVRGVTDLMVKPGLVNLDFADIRTVMREMGKAMMGTGEATGEKRAIEAAEAAISNPLLDDVSLRGARAALINITGGSDMTLFEVDEAANRIREEMDADANIIFGSTFNDELEGIMRVSVVATGIDGEVMAKGEGEEADQRRPAGGKRPFSGYMPAVGVAGNQPSRRTASASGYGREPAMLPKTATAAAPSKPASFSAPAPKQQQHQPEPTPMVDADEAFAFDVAADQEAMQQAEAEQIQYESHNTPSVQHDVREEAPRHQAQPELFTGVSPRAERHAAPRSHNPQPQLPMAEEEQEEPAPGFSFMNKIADVKRALSAKAAENMPASSQRSVQVRETRRPVPGISSAEEEKMQMPSFIGKQRQRTHEMAGGSEDENLDIPAFLRRQAN